MNIDEVVTKLLFEVGPPCGNAGRVVIAKLDGVEILRNQFNTNKFDSRVEFAKLLASELGITGDITPLIRYCLYKIVECADAVDAEVYRLRNAAETEDAAAVQSCAVKTILKWPEEWPDPVLLDDVLNEAVEAIRRYVVITPEAAAAVALWAAWTYVYDYGLISPVLMILSPTKRCGKTTLLRVLQCLVCRPLPASNCSNAAIYRAIEKYAPLTLLLDEVDTFAFGDSELRGIVNSGHMKEFGYVLRSVPIPDSDYDMRPYATWCPKVVAAIGNLYDTWADRSVIVRMERKGANEKVERLDTNATDYLKTISRKLFTATNTDEIKAALRAFDPVVPEGLNSRAADNWTPLLCIADVAGGRWPVLARRAALLLSGVEEEEDWAVRLLLDCADAFENETELSARAIAERLIRMPDTPWATYARGKPISAVTIGRTLRRFGIKPKKTEINNVYCRGDILAAADRYAPISPDLSSRSSSLDVNPYEIKTYVLEDVEQDLS